MQPRNRRDQAEQGSAGSEEEVPHSADEGAMCAEDRVIFQSDEEESEDDTWFDEMIVQNLNDDAEAQLLPDSFDIFDGELPPNSPNDKAASPCPLPDRPVARPLQVPEESLLALQTPPPTQPREDSVVIEDSPVQTVTDFECNDRRIALLKAQLIELEQLKAKMELEKEIRWGPGFVWASRCIVLNALIFLGACTCGVFSKPDQSHVTPEYMHGCLFSNFFVSTWYARKKVMY